MFGACNTLEKPQTQLMHAREYLVYLGVLWRHRKQSFCLRPPTTDNQITSESRTRGQHKTRRVWSNATRRHAECERRRHRRLATSLILRDECRSRMKANLQQQPTLFGNCAYLLYGPLDPTDLSPMRRPVQPRSTQVTRAFHCVTV